MNIKYLEHLKLYGDEVFLTDTNELTFDIISAINLSDRVFTIVRKSASNWMPNFHGTVRDTFELSRFATNRRIEMSKDKSSIDFESFELELGGGESYEFVYDYSFLFDYSLEDKTIGDYFVGFKVCHAWLYPLADSIKATNRSEYLDAEYKSNNVYALYQIDRNGKTYDDIPFYKIGKKA